MPRPFEPSTFQLYLALAVMLVIWVVLLLVFEVRE